MNKLEKKTKLAEFAVKFDKISARVITVITVLTLAFLLSSVYDMLHYSMRGIKGVKYASLEELRKSNPDTVGWLEMYGTNINHPVVQGRDNQEYLTKDFYGAYYSGGTLFLDFKNKKDFSDDYNIIHGHHMTNGAMFGDLQKYLDKDFFDTNDRGYLRTTNGNYQLRVFGVATVDAQDLRIYNVEPQNRMEYIDGLLKNKRDMEAGPILALSTCTGSLDESRTVVFCYMDKEK